MRCTGGRVREFTRPVQRDVARLAQSERRGRVDGASQPGIGRRLTWSSRTVLPAFNSTALAVATRDRPVGAGDQQPRRPRLAARTTRAGLRSRSCGGSCARLAETDGRFVSTGGAESCRRRRAAGSRGDRAEMTPKTWSRFAVDVNSQRPHPMARGCRAAPARPRRSLNENDVSCESACSVAASAGPSMTAAASATARASMPSCERPESVTVPRTTTVSVGAVSSGGERLLQRLELRRRTGV